MVESRSTVALAPCCLIKKHYTYFGHSQALDGGKDYITWVKVGCWHSLAQMTDSISIHNHRSLPQVHIVGISSQKRSWECQDRFIKQVIGSKHIRQDINPIVVQTVTFFEAFIQYRTKFVDEAGDKLPLFVDRWVWWRMKRRWVAQGRYVVCPAMWSFRKYIRWWRCLCRWGQLLELMDKDAWTFIATTHSIISRAPSTTWLLQVALSQY